MLDPAKLISRTARRLARHAAIEALITSAPQPRIKKRRTDPGITGGQSMLNEALALWLPRAHDSS